MSQASDYRWSISGRISGRESAKGATETVSASKASGGSGDTAPPGPLDTPARSQWAAEETRLKWRVSVFADGAKISQTNSMVSPSPVMTKARLQISGPRVSI